MADTRPTPISLLRATQLCFLLLFATERFIKEEERDLANRGNYSGQAEKPHRAHVVRRAFWSSLALVAASAVLGFVGAWLVHAAGRCATAATVAWLQVGGASLLLWGTLFVRGWEIQTYSGVVFTERVNQWLYRGLYCVGTSIIVYSLAFPSCMK